MALNHTNPGAQPHDSAPGPVALNRTTPGPQDRQYSLPFFGAAAYAAAYFFVTSNLAAIDSCSSTSTPHRGRPHVPGGNYVRYGPYVRGDST